MSKLVRTTRGDSPEVAFIVHSKAHGSCQELARCKGMLLLAVPNKFKRGYAVILQIEGRGRYAVIGCRHYRELSINGVIAAANQYVTRWALKGLVP